MNSLVMNEIKKRGLNDGRKITLDEEFADALNLSVTDTTITCFNILKHLIYSKPYTNNIEKIKEKMFSIFKDELLQKAPLLHLWTFQTPI
jgi:hypothetical protein